MNDDSLLNLSPLDGRYAGLTQALRTNFSEFALMKFRIQTELYYIIYLSKWKIIRRLKSKEIINILSILNNFSLTDAKRIKTFEEETKHDVKALEYFLKEKITGTSVEDLLPFVHFGLTSDDVNAVAYGLALTAAHKKIMLGIFERVLSAIQTIGNTNVGSAMLAKTHGQPAVPTTFGKEIAVFYSRIHSYQAAMKTFRFEGKLNGAVGNYNALILTFPDTDWLKFSKQFLSSLGLTPNLTTTQILPYDGLVDYTMMLTHINGILIGLCQDMWQYISQGLLVLARDPKQVGSSTMPHKINPIDFENAEGNLMIANSYFELYARKLLVSRLQRDLSDSTVRRTIGTALGHTLIAWKSIIKGLGKISFNKTAAISELNQHWEILSEAIQVYLKVHGDEKGYETVKAATQGKQLNAETYRALVRQFPPLAKLTPETYIGLAQKLTKLALKS